MTLPRLYPILDVATVEARGGDLVAWAAALLEGGAGMVQLRQKGHWSRERFREASCIRTLCGEAGILFVVNDRADFALLLGAALHLGQEDLPPSEARRLLGPEAVIGFSTHNAEQLQAARTEPVDYVALGPIFSTGSKERPEPVVGVTALRQWRSMNDLPLVAIGGITRVTAPEVWAAGADSVAVIGDLYPERATPRSIRERMEEWQRLATP